MKARCLILFLLAVGACTREPAEAPAENKQPPRPTVDVSACSTIAAVPMAMDGDDAAWVGVALAEEINRRLFARNDLGSFTGRQVAAAMGEARVTVADMTTATAAQELGRHLGACFLLVGQGKVDGDRILGTAQVIEVANGQTRASMKLDSPLSGLAALEDQVAGQLAAVIGGALDRAQPAPGAEIPIEVVADTTRVRMLLGQQSLSPRAANPMAFMGITAKQLDEARQRLTAAAKKAPRYADTWALLGLVEAMAGNPVEAWRQLEQASILLPAGSPTVILGQSFVRMREGRFDAAEKILRTAVAAHPGFLHGRGSLAELLMHFGRLREAKSILQKYLQRAPDQPWVLAKMARIDAMLGRPDDAVSETRKAVALVPKSTYLLTELASRQIDAEQLEDAQKTLEQVLQIAPGEARALVRLGYVQLLRGDDQGAISTSQKAVQLTTGSRYNRERAYAELNLARAYGHLGKEEEALAHLENAVGEPGISLDEIETDPKLEKLRKNPRYQILVRPSASTGTFTID